MYSRLGIEALWQRSACIDEYVYQKNKEFWKVTPCYERYG
jgi:hypothetical protein